MAAKLFFAPQQLLTALFLIAALFFANAFTLLSRLSTSKLDSSQDSEVYHFAEVFKLQYEEMEKNFKIYVYPDGDTDRYHSKPIGKYASEGYFFHNIRDSRFRTYDPEKAHMFFLPISFHNMLREGISHKNMTKILAGYVATLIAQHGYWYRSSGINHFFISCHDSGLRVTEKIPILTKRSIRVVCSPTYNSVYIPHKDVAFPQIMQPFAFPAGGNDLENRTKLAFWGGHINSKLKQILVSEWWGDTELDIQSRKISRLVRGLSLYEEKFFTSRFCLCPRGSQASSVRIADSIHYGCIPDLPFNDILDWTKFSVVIREEDVYRVKDILKNISDANFTEMHKNLIKVQKHFEWNSPPKKYDAFHMVMYELWLRHHRVMKYSA